MIGRVRSGIHLADAGIDTWEQRPPRIGVGHGGLAWNVRRGILLVHSNQVVRQLADIANLQHRVPRQRALHAETHVMYVGRSDHWREEGGKPHWETELRGLRSVDIWERVHPSSIGVLQAERTVHQFADHERLV